MAKVISVTSGKGGVGKSSVSTGIATAFALGGRKVIIVELDIGLRNVDLILGIEDRVIYDLGDIVSGRCPVEDAIVQTEQYDCLHYIAAPSSISVEFDFQKVIDCIKSLKAIYDFIIIDTPAGLGVSILSVNYLSDLAIIVATPDPTCIRGGAKVAMLAENGGFSNYRLVINRVSRAALKRSAIRDLDEVMDGVGAPLLGVIPDDSEYRFALTRGEPVDQKKKIAAIYHAIAKRIEGEYVPLVLNRL